MFHDLSHRLRSLGLLGAACLPLAACGPTSTTTLADRGVESVHQPVVSHESYAYDIRTDDGLRLSGAERTRLAGWLDSLGVGYGDSLTLATNGAGIPESLARDIGALLAPHGLAVLEDDSPAAGAPPEGVVRLILRRATASVPGCPDWKTKQESDMVGGTSSNFGCGVNGNLAAMVADPDDLLRGRTSDSPLRTVPSTKAIKTYIEQAPTGAGGLKTMTATGASR